MTGYRIVQVDAFASAAFEGNPAAVMPLDAERFEVTRLSSSSSGPARAWRSRRRTSGG